MINKPNIASIVARQFPEFVRDDYKKLIAFIEAYYEYLKVVEGEDLYTLRDLDTTLDSFIRYFKKELATNVPNALVNERFLLSQVKHEYLAKGSEASFKLLFRILFDKEVEVVYPTKQILRASDGKWNQEVSMFVKVNYGSIENIVGKKIDVVTSDKTVNLLVERYQEVELTDDGVTYTSPNIFEVFVNRKYFGNFNVGDTVKYNAEFFGEVMPTTSNITIIQAGKGFKLGEIYYLKNGQGVGSTLKISKVDSDGAILQAQFITFGTRYETDFTNTIVAYGERSKDAIINTINVSLPDVSFGEAYSGIIESGSLNSYDYNIDIVSPAIDPSYAGVLLRNFFIDNTQMVIQSDIAAVIQIGVGSVAKYPGFYSTNDGFLDDAIYIQDSKYYQAFSYVTIVDEQLETYKSVVKQLLHPSGMALFGEYEIRNTFDLSATLELAGQILTLAFSDQAFATAQAPTLDIVKHLTETLVIQDFPLVVMDKYISTGTSDIASVSDTGGAVWKNPYWDISYILNDAGYYTEGVEAEFQ